MTELIEILPGHEVMDSLAKQVADRGIADAAITLVGAVDAATISTMPADDPSRDVLTEYRQPLELTGTGEVRAGAVHVHVVLGAEGDRALAGHLHAAEVRTFFVRAYLTTL